MRIEFAGQAFGSPNETAETLRQVRRDLRGLIALELLQTAIAVGSLVAIATYAATTTPDREVAISIAVAGLLALAYLAFAFRVRMGQEIVRHDVAALEVRQELEGMATALSPDPAKTSHPYRSAGSLPRR